MLLFRTTAAHLLDLVVNHPDVRPTIQSGMERLSTMSVLTDWRNVCYAGEGGALLFIYDGGRAYKGHVMLIPEARGAKGVAFGRACFEALSSEYGARFVRAAVPLTLPAARWYARRLGMRSQGVASNGLEELFEMEM